MVRCDTCGEDFSRKDALTRHKKYSCDASHKTEAKRIVDCVAKREESNSKPIDIPPETHDSMSQEIPTFDVAEFSGEKPKSEETLIKIMEMLKIPQEKCASILKEEKQLEEQTFKKVPSKEPPAKKMKIIPLLSKSDQQKSEQSTNKARETSPPIVKAPHLNVEEKKCLNRFSQLFRETKQSGKDNAEQLCILLDRLEDRGTLDEASCDKAYDAIVDICK